jgi:hypothetical protein
MSTSEELFGLEAELRTVHDNAGAEADNAVRKYLAAVGASNAPR